VISERCHRARINSAIFVSSEGRGFDSIEFIRRYGSQSVLCRKAKSAENLPAGNRNVSRTYTSRVTSLPFYYRVKTRELHCC
jgi:hypothetical protein